MSEGEMSFSALRDKVLKLLIDERVNERSTGHPGELSEGEIMQALEMTTDQCEMVADYLFEAGYARCGGLAGLGTLMSVTTKGIELYERQHETPSLHVAGNVGAIYHGPVQGTQIQAVASAVHSSVQQVVEGAHVQEIRQAITQTIEDMVSAVQRELTVEQLEAYAQIAREFQNEVVKENPDQGRIRRMISILSFLSDAEGTIQFGERFFTLGSHVAPYLPLLISLLARYFSG
jgi:hypothetical protein